MALLIFNGEMEMIKTYSVQQIIEEHEDAFDIKLLLEKARTNISSSVPLTLVNECQKTNEE